MLTVQHVLHGDMEWHKLWDHQIDEKLNNKRFANTTHEQKFYCGRIDGSNILLCRYVDDFCAGVAEKKNADILSNALAKDIDFVQ